MLRFLDFFRTQAVLRARQRAARGGRHVDRGPPAEGYPDRRGGARVRPRGALAAALQYKRVLEYVSRYGIRSCSGGYLVQKGTRVLVSL